MAFGESFGAVLPVSHAIGPGSWFLHFRGRLPVQTFGLVWEFHSDPDAELYLGSYRPFEYLAILRCLFFPVALRAIIVEGYV